MKKLLSAFLILSMVVGLLAACSAPETPDTTESTEGVNKPIMNIYQQSDPAADDTVNILMIGNSHCYYYADELVGLAAAAGIKLRVSNIYHSGCIIRQHYQWWKEGQSNYTFITHDQNGRTEDKDVNLDYCLKQANWDMISLQTGTADFMAKPAEVILSETREMRKELWDYIKMHFPQSQYYWHHTWSYQLGGEKFGVKYDEPSKQHTLDQNIATLAKQVCMEDGLIRIPSGEAWRRVRDAGYDNMCARIGVTGDYGHDGDVGGGQYLNACVWFERVLGQNCIGNTFRPNYTLSEDLIAMFQKAAHDTVAELKADEEGM